MSAFSFLSKAIIPQVAGVEVLIELVSPAISGSIVDIAFPSLAVSLEKTQLKTFVDFSETVSF